MSKWHWSIVAAALTITGCSNEPKTLSGAWEGLRSSWLGGQFKFKCGSDLYRVSKPFSGDFKLEWLDHESNWYPLQITSMSDGGMDFQGLSWHPVALDIWTGSPPPKLAEFKRQREADIKKVSGEYFQDYFIKYEIEESLLVPATTHIDFFKGLHESHFLPGNTVKVRVTYKLPEEGSRYLYNKQHDVSAPSFIIRGSSCDL